MALRADHLGTNAASILLGLGIGFAGFYFFANKKAAPTSPRSQSPEAEPQEELCFFRVEDGQLLFHLKLYVETLNNLWQREGVWPNRYFYMKENKWAARKLARKLMVVAIERPDIFSGVQSRYILAARAFTLGHYLGINELSPLEASERWWGKLVRETPSDSSPVPYRDYGTLLYERSDLSNSALQLKRALALGEEGVCLLLAVVLASSGDKATAKEYLERYLQHVDPVLPEHRMASALLENLGKPDALDIMYLRGSEASIAA